MKGNIVLGTLAMLGLIGAVALVAVRELDRMETAQRAYDARAVESGALEFENRCRPCHGPQGGGSPLAPALNSADLFDGSRLQAAGYTGTVEDYVRGVIAAGRPIPSAGTNYPQRMPTWGEEYGGPLRDDQVDALVLFIMNWKDRALAAGGGAPAIAPDQAVGTDVAQTLPEGDPENGKILAEGSLGCAACHLLSNAGPAWTADGANPGIATRAGERLAETGYAGQAETPDQYLLESVVNPNIYLVDGFQAGIMPANFATRLTHQDAADLIAYMLTFE
ncbi:MAG TPA: c-type cytochrome [Anaerolineales bacterium]|nr:c-type cytochrome [Anaerolineales bacterium]